MDLELKQVEQRLPMLFEKNRLASFKSWKFNDRSKCSAKKLAEAGFYYAGTPDEPDGVQCFLCNKALDGWEKEDNPWDEHISHSKNCEFAKLRLPEAKLTTDRFLQFCLEMVLVQSKNYVTKVVESNKKEFSQKYTAKKKTLNGIRKK
ncbi:hypothetical protein PPYR_14749 [Photinus pyralis]|uniref:Uncharacterized protein n=1 Tax=Photinus pyralis TaxID=7054 RepID=A0A1Y1L6S4_PHOPY|nr:baculoviral IAP repeat-containing protein 5 [Photinus pyralis]KAB0792790.1 hypothetical protein PPYR_14749 [Photinus pyralis]